MQVMSIHVKFMSNYKIHGKFVFNYMTIRVENKNHPGVEP